MRVGVFGGSFDPPHIGHAIVAQAAREELALDRVLFVPALRPPHKPERRLAPAGVRVEMVQAMIARDDRFRVEELELRREGPSFTVETLRDLASREPGDRLVLLLGADQFAEFHTWREPDEIVLLAEIAVLSRGGVMPREPAGKVPHRRVRVPRIDISSSDIRERVSAGKPVRYLVTGPVLEIIEREGLYRVPAPEPVATRGDRGPC